jgi:hypothetical protein
VPVHPQGTAAFYAPIRAGNDGEMTVAWDLAPLPEDDHHHASLVLADPQTLDMEDIRRLQQETVPDVRATVKELGSLPVVGISCGDIMFNNLGLFPEYEQAVRTMGIPFFQVLGNHDVEIASKSDDASIATFARYFGPTSYSFNRGAVHYVVLDDVFWFGDGYMGYLTDELLQWLRADLQCVEAGRTVVVFMHIPSYCTQHLRSGQAKPEHALVVVNRELLNGLLEPYRAHVIVGHMHESEHLTDGKVKVHVCGAVCGAWWTGPICADGTPNGYSVFEAKGEEISWRYKSTGLPFDHQMRVSPRGTDAAAPEEIVANVWDYDQDWKVVWYEDGIRKGEMKKVRGTDPLSVKLHTGSDLPRKHTWVEPYTTDHLFRAAVSPGAKDVRVEATDGRGRVYVGRPGDAAGR